MSMTSRANEVLCDGELLLMAIGGTVVRKEQWGGIEARCRWRERPRYSLGRAVGQYAQRRVSDCRQMMLTGTLASFSVVPLVKRTLVGTRRCTYASWGGIGRLGTARAPEPKSPTGLMPRESEKAL